MNNIGHYWKSPVVTFTKPNGETKREVLILLFIKDTDKFKREDRYIRIKENNLDIDIDILGFDLDRYVHLNSTDKDAFGVHVRSSIDSWIGRTLCHESTAQKESFKQKTMLMFYTFMSEPMLRDMLFQDHLDYFLSFKQGETNE